MQDTWLLALTIRNNPPVTVDDALYQRCFEMIQQVQDKLAVAGASDAFAEEIKFAQSVFIDEAVMTQSDTDVSTWCSVHLFRGIFWAISRVAIIFTSTSKSCCANLLLLRR